MTEHLGNAKDSFTEHLGTVLYLGEREHEPLALRPRELAGAVDGLKVEPEVLLNIDRSIGARRRNNAARVRFCVVEHRDRPIDRGRSTRRWIVARGFRSSPSFLWLSRARSRFEEADATRRGANPAAPSLQHARRAPWAVVAAAPLTLMVEGIFPSRRSTSSAWHFSSMSAASRSCVVPGVRWLSGGGGARRAPGGGRRGAGSSARVLAGRTNPRASPQCRAVTSPRASRARRRKRGGGSAAAGSLWTTALALRRDARARARARCVVCGRREDAWGGARARPQTRRRGAHRSGTA